MMQTLSPKPKIPAAIMFILMLGLMGAPGTEAAADIDTMLLPISDDA
jgi:hypothetical protein